MNPHASIYDELYKRRRSTRMAPRPTAYCCDNGGLTLAEAWYATASGSLALHDKPPSPFIQSAPQFEAAFMDAKGHYQPVFRIATAAQPPSMDPHARRWQLLDDVLHQAMRRAASPEWQDTLLVIYDPDALDDTGSALDTWLAHWSTELRPRGGMVLTSQPFFEWLRDRLSHAQDTHLHFCYVALEPIDPMTASPSPGESATVLWMERWQTGQTVSASPTPGMALSAPIFNEAPCTTETLTTLLAPDTSYAALVWDGHDSTQLKPLLKAVQQPFVQEVIDSDALWFVRRLTGALYHYDALQIALAANVATVHQVCVRVLNTSRLGRGASLSVTAMTPQT